MTKVLQGWRTPKMGWVILLTCLLLVALFTSAGHALAHNVTVGDAG